MASLKRLALASVWTTYLAVAAAGAQTSVSDDASSSCESPSNRSAPNGTAGAPSKLLKATVTKESVDNFPPNPPVKAKPPNSGQATFSSSNTVMKPSGPTAAQINAEIAWLARYKHMRTNPTASAGGHFLKNVRAVFPTASMPAVPPAKPLAGAGSKTSAIKTQPASGRQLPRWGDKSCLCHEGFRLFQQHKFLESAGYYRKAGDNMLNAWGHATNDVANARRGEAVCYGAVGNYGKAKDLYREAISIYLTSSGGRPSPELQDSILDLSDAYKNSGDAARAKSLSFNARQLCYLAATNPVQAEQQFNSLLRNGR